MEEPSKWDLEQNSQEKPKQMQFVMNENINEKELKNTA